MVVYESNNNPHPQKRQFVTEIINHAREHIAFTVTVEQRATELEQKGIKAIDALHFALAEAGQVDYFCTCDDHFYRRALTLPDVAIKVRQPLELALEIKV